MNHYSARIEIDGHLIENFGKPFTIAEVSGNHKGEIERAKQLIKAAKESGFSAVKLQFFTPEEMTLNSHEQDFVISGGLWAGRTLFSVYQEGAMPEAWLTELFSYAKALDITIFSSVFSPLGLAVLEKLECPAYKIASFEAMDIPLIEAAIKTGKPLIVSTGIIDEQGIDDVINLCKTHQFNQLALLHCISNYPAPCETFNLSTLADMMTKYQVPTGLSDHSFDELAATLSVAMGGCIIEKHITVARDDGAIDSEFSLPISEMPAFIERVNLAHATMGKANYQSSSPRKNYRSLYVVEDIEAGAPLTSTNIRAIRPGHGLPPKHYDKVLGKKVKKALKAGTPLRWEVINE